MSLRIYKLFNALLERILLERQTSWRISFSVYDLRKFKDGRTEAEQYRSLSEHIGVDEYAGYCKVNVTNTATFPSQNYIR